MRESDIENWSGDLAKRSGWWHRKFASPGKRSAPDRVFAKKGRVFFVEFKATGQEPTLLQQHEHALMREAGLTVYVCDSRENFGLTLKLEEDMLAFS